MEDQATNEERSIVLQDATERMEKSAQLDRMDRMDRNSNPLAFWKWL